jgi:hypothetical protein
VARLSDEQVRYLISDIVAHALTRMGDPTPERTDALRAVVRMHCPQLAEDEFDLRDVVAKVAAGLNGMANLVQERRDRLVATGRAAPFVGR